MINKVHEKTIVIMHDEYSFQQATYLLLKYMTDMNEKRRQNTYDFMIFTSEHEDVDKRNITIKWSIEKIEPEFIK